MWGLQCYTCKILSLTQKEGNGTFSLILINFDHSHSLSSFTATPQPLVFIESIEPPYPLSSLSWRMKTILGPCSLTYCLRTNIPPHTRTHARTHTRAHTHTPHIVISPSLFFTLFSMRLYFEQHNAVTSTEHSQVRHLEVILSVSLWWCWVISLLSFSFCLFKLSVCVRERETVSGQTSATFLSASDVCPCICVSVLSHLWASIDFN